MHDFIQLFHRNEANPISFALNDGLSGACFPFSCYSIYSLGTLPLCCSMAEETVVRKRKPDFSDNGDDAPRATSDESDMDILQDEGRLVFCLDGVENPRR